MLLIEPINRYRVSLVHTVSEGIKMINNIGLANIHLVADTFHMQMEEINGIPSAVFESANHLKCLHIGDNTRLAPGYGVMDWRSIITALYEINFDGPLSYETVFTGFDLKKMTDDTEYSAIFDKHLSDGINYLRQIMTSVNWTKDWII